jgi:FAD/FMN-containing dehydrogenase
MSDDNTGTALRNAARTVHLPGDDGYDEARANWSLAKDLRPAAVVQPVNAEEVAAVVRTAAAAGLRVAPLGTGHNSHALGDLAGTVLLKTSRMNAVRIDPDTRTARAEAGAVWLPIAEQAGAHKLAALHGSSPDTGVVGYSLGGGISWYGRSQGLAVNKVTAVEMVLADGTFVRADADHEPDLFWAVRGANANVGVVTALEFTLIPLETAYAGMIAFDVARAAEVLPRWLSWTAEAPETATTAYRHLQLPPIEDVPEPFRGRRLIIIDGAVLAGDDEAQRILAPLRELKPEMDTFGRIPAAAVPRIHMDPEQPTPGGGRGTLLDDLPAAAADQLLEVAGPDTLSPLVALTELRHLGGALGRPQAGGGALSALDGAFEMITGGFVVGDMKEPTYAACDRVMGSLASYSRGRTYLPFQHAKLDLSAAFDDAALKRLRQIRAAADPAGVLQANHEL